MKMLSILYENLFHPFRLGPPIGIIGDFIYRSLIPGIIDVFKNGMMILIRLNL